MKLPKNNKDLNLAKSKVTIKCARMSWHGVDFL